YASRVMPREGSRRRSIAPRVGALEEEIEMKLGQALAMTAVTGMFAGLVACAGEQKAEPQSPSSDVAAPADKNCRQGQNECKGKSGCKTETNATCAGSNECKGKGTSCPKAS